MLKRTKNREESEMKNSAAPMAVVRVAALGTLTQRKMAKQFMAPLMSSYRNMG